MPNMQALGKEEKLKMGQVKVGCLMWKGENGTSYEDFQ